jgi:hypothetical protein
VHISKGLVAIGADYFDPQYLLKAVLRPHGLGSLRARGRHWLRRSRGLFAGTNAALMQAGADLSGRTHRNEGHLGVLVDVT